MRYFTVLPDTDVLSEKRLSSGLGNPSALGLRNSPLRCMAFAAKKVATYSGGGMTAS